MENVKWRFPLADGGTKFGISHSGIESFTGSRIGSLTREIIQNSLDAKDKNKKNSPVIVEFKTFLLESSFFPGKNDLYESMQLALIESSNLKGNRTKQFYEKAIKILTSKNIKMLRISDFNTTGLTGVEKEDNSNWHYLVKSQGISDKGGTDGGSFGIGKNATYTVSNLRTIFYETLNIEGYKGSAGASNIISYRVEDKNDYTQGIGYFGVGDKSQAYPDFLYLDKSFKRTEPGTDIFITGLIEDENLNEDIIGSVLESFMYAIYKNTLEVKVDNLIINSNSLEEVINKFDKSLKQTTKEMFYLLTNPNTHEYQINILNTITPDIELRLILEENASRKISMIRKPWMKITEFDQFQRAYQFSGLVIIKGEEINSLLRRAENPQHNNWEPDRLIEEPHTKKRVREVITEIRKNISNKLQELHKRDLSDFLDIYGASDYLPQITDESEKKIHEKIEEKTASIEVIKVDPSRQSNEILSFEDGESLIESDGDEIIDAFVLEEIDYVREKKEGQKIIDEIKKGKKVSLTKQNYRIITINPDLGEYQIALKVDKAKNYNLKLLLLDEQSNTVNNYLIIDSANFNNELLNIEKDQIKNINLFEGINRIKVEINLKGYFSLGVELYEI